MPLTSTLLTGRVIILSGPALAMGGFLLVVGGLLLQLVQNFSLLHEINSRHPVKKGIAKIIFLMKIILKNKFEQ
jgi:hypothetical protein